MDCEDCTKDTRDQPNNSVRMTLEDGQGGGDSFRVGASLLLGSRACFLFGERFRSGRGDNQQKGLNLSR